MVLERIEDMRAPKIEFVIRAISEQQPDIDISGGFGGEFFLSFGPADLVNTV